MPLTNPGPARRGRPRLPWGSILRNLALALVILAGLWLVLNVHLPGPGDLREDIAEAGVWGAGFFVVLYTVVAATPIPVTIVAVAGGLAFGLPLGTLLSMIGVVLGGWAGYWVARVLGRQTARKMLGSHAEAVESQLHGGGLYAVATLRLMPGFPYWPVNYGSGAFGIDNRTFVIATVISSLPGQLSLVAIGAFIGDPTIPNGIAVGVAWLLVGGLTIVSFRRWRGTRHPDPAPPPEGPDPGSASPQ